MLNIVLQDLRETFQIVFNFLDQALLCIGRQPKSGIARATDCTVYAGIAYFHHIFLESRKRSDRINIVPTP